MKFTVNRLSPGNIHEAKTSINHPRLGIHQDEVDGKPYAIITAYGLHLVKKGDMDFIPVPISIAWIEKLGFDRQGARNMWIKNRCCVILYDMPNIKGESTGEKFYIGYKDWGNVLYHTQFTVDYVHELQNAYALTGEELTISS